MSDVLRGVLVLGFLFVTPESLPLLFVIQLMVFSVSAFFISTKAAILPSITLSTELISANALGQTTWGVMVAVGAFSAGIVLSIFGFDFAIVLNSITFFVSAFFLRNVVVTTDVKLESTTRKKITPWQDFKNGISYVLESRFRIALILTKPGWALGGGAVLTLHTVFGEHVFHEGSYGIGVLYMCRGLGVIIGSLLAKRLMSVVHENNVLWFISGAFVLYGLLYGTFSLMPGLYSSAVMLIFATASSANLWFFSRITLQKIVPSELRGRIFAHDEALSTLFLMISALLAGWALDSMPPRTVALFAAMSMIGCGLLLGLSMILRFIPKQSELNQ